MELTCIGTRGFAPIYVSICQSKAAGWSAAWPSILNGFTRTWKRCENEDQQTISRVLPQQELGRQKIFFSIRFSQPFTQTDKLPRKAKEAAPRYILQFDLKDRILQTKIALSTVSIRGQKYAARVTRMGFCGHSNRHQKMEQLPEPDWYRSAAKSKEIFYSCLYRLLFNRRISPMWDGRYRGRMIPWEKPGMGKVLFHPFLMGYLSCRRILYIRWSPRRKWTDSSTAWSSTARLPVLPIWTAWGQDNYCMIGNHAIPVIADAHSKGFTGFDAEEALRQMIRARARTTSAATGHYSTSMAIILSTAWITKRYRERSNMVWMITA